MNIDLNKNLVYPSTIFLPSNIKNKSPFLLLSLNDGISTINYTFIPNKINENGVDLLKKLLDLDPNKRITAL